jgi:hypothetical protein
MYLSDRRCAGNVWFIPYETVQFKTEKFDHPAGFPVGLPLRCLIPRLADQNPCAQSRRPIDMMVQGCATSLFQAWQQ